jgi:hypothetical protein
MLVFMHFLERGTSQFFYMLFTFDKLVIFVLLANTVQ